MHVVNLGEASSILNQYLGEIRDETIQKDRLRFRKNIERCGEILAYEISKKLHYQPRQVKTSLGMATILFPVQQPVIGCILRAGIILHQGMLNFFDLADSAFIGAFRKHDGDGSFHISLKYITSPPLQDRIFILADPMLATGSSLVNSLKDIFKNGVPLHTHIACVIATQQGIETVLREFTGITIWACAIDDELNSQGYIVPGLGDAGDLAFGEKTES